MTVLQSTPKLGDLLKMELDYRYCREGATYTNSSGADITLPVGQPFVLDGAGNATLVATLGEASTNGLFIHEVDIIVPNGESRDLTFLTMGPVIVNRDAIPSDDLASGSLDIDAVVAALEALSPPFKIVSEPVDDSSEEQTT